MRECLSRGSCQSEVLFRAGLQSWVKIHRLRLPVCCKVSEHKQLPKSIRLCVQYFMQKHHLFNATIDSANDHKIQRCKREADYRFKASTDSYKSSISHPSRARNRHPSARGHPISHRTCTKFIVHPQTSDRAFLSSENILW